MRRFHKKMAFSMRPASAYYPEYTSPPSRDQLFKLVLLSCASLIFVSIVQILKT